MFPSESLIDKYGPLIVLATMAYYALPSLINQVMHVVSTSTQSQATVKEGPLTLATLIIEKSAKSEAEFKELIQADLKELKLSIDKLYDAFTDFVQSHKGQSS